MDKINVNMVLYTDGSGGNSTDAILGMGYHGYYYEDNIKKTSDLPAGAFPSKRGYIGQDNLLEFATVNVEHLRISPIGYLDGYLSKADFTGTSVEAEVYATEFGLKEVLNYFKKEDKYNLKSIEVLTDSLYSIYIFQRCLKHVKNYEELDLFITEYKKPITIAMVTRIYKFLFPILEEHPDLNLIFTKDNGHTGNVGNELADRLAGTARKLCNLSKEKNIEHSSWTIGKYWKPNVDKHPFLRYRDLYFMHNDVNPYANLTVMNYIGIDKVGSRTSNPIFGIVRLKELPKILKEVIDAYKDNFQYNPVLIYAVDMEKLYKPEYQSYINGFGIKALLPNKNSQLKILDMEPVVYPVYPPGMGRKAYDLTQNLSNVLDQALLDIEKGGNKTRQVIDITDRIYNTVKNKRVITLGMKDEIPVEFTSDNKKIKITLVPDIDFINRNHLKQMEKDDVKVYLYLVRTGVNCWVYYTIIKNKTLDAVGIWHNMYSSKVILENKKDVQQ